MRLGVRDSKFPFWEDILDLLAQLCLTHNRSHGDPACTLPSLGARLKSGQRRSKVLNGDILVECPLGRLGFRAVLGFRVP